MIRRHFITGGVMYAISNAVTGYSQEFETPIHVMKDPNCGCCKKWAQIVSETGFKVTFEDVITSDLIKYKKENGIVPQMASCHTARVFDYLIEGHVPPDDIKLLLSKKPIAIGLSVPGMPYGSPGMGPEDKREPYKVYLLKKDGTTSVFNSYEAAP